jgi:succinate dehydrogenase/fumarate reductase flavoprotein subunit
VLADLKETEAETAYAANPHELGRLLECHSVIATSELILNACLARKGSNPLLMFARLDYPDMDPSEWGKWLSIRQQNGETKVRDVPLDYHLQAPYAPDYKENYTRHCGK